MTSHAGLGPVRTTTQRQRTPLSRLPYSRSSHNSSTPHPAPKTPSQSTSPPPSIRTCSPNSSMHGRNREQLKALFRQESPSPGTGLHLDEAGNCDEVDETCGPSPLDSIQPLEQHNLRLVQDMMEQASPNFEAALLVVFTYMVHQTERIDQLKRDIIAGRTADHILIPKAFTEAVRGVCWHYLVQPVNNYTFLHHIITTWIWDNPYLYHLQAHTDNEVAQENFNREISSVLSDVKGTFRTTIFNLVGAKKIRGDLHTFVKEIYLKRCLGTPSTVPTVIFAHFAFLRNVARPYASVHKRKGDRSSSGFWEEVAIQLAKQVRKHGQDRTSPGWTQWAQEQIKLDAGE